MCVLLSVQGGGSVSGQIWERSKEAGCLMDTSTKKAEWLQLSRSKAPRDGASELTGCSVRR